jgi:hypothetical protein
MELTYKQVYDAILEVLKTDSNYSHTSVSELISDNKVSLEELLYLLYYRKLNINMNL